MEAILHLGDRTHRLAFSEATVHLHGEFAGNIDLSLASGPQLATREVLDSLRLEVVGETVLLDTLGYLEADDRLKLTFFSEHVRETQNVPRSVDAYWGDSKEIYLGALPCTEAVAPPAEVASYPPEHLASIMAPDAKALRRGKVKGCLALIGFSLFLLATLYVLFPEVRALFE